MSTLPMFTPKETHFITDNKRSIAKRGFSINALVEHLQDHLVSPRKYRGQVWCDLSCAARTFYGRASEENRIQMRRRFSKATPDFLDRDLLLLKFFGGAHGAIKRVKLYDPLCPDDVKFAIKQYEVEQGKGELSEERLQQMERIVGSDVLRRTEEPSRTTNAAATSTQET